MNELRQEIARLSDQLHVKLDRLIDNKLKSAIEVDSVLRKLSVLYDKIEDFRQSLPRQMSTDDEKETMQGQSGTSENEIVEPTREKEEAILPPPPLAPEPPPIKTPHEVEKQTSVPLSTDETASVQAPAKLFTSPTDSSIEEETSHSVSIDPVEPIAPHEQKPLPELSMPPSPAPKSKAASATGDLFATPSVSDKLRNDQPSINDKMNSTRKDFSLADSIQLKPISDLKANIGINEKFQFVNDLFDGSTSDYNEAINHLNNCLNSDEALAALLTLRIQHSWEEEDASFAMLRAYVARRYM